jgi:hypothetical protein
LLAAERVLLAVTLLIGPLSIFASGCYGRLPITDRDMMAFTVAAVSQFAAGVGTFVCGALHDARTTRRITGSTGLGALGLVVGLAAPVTWFLCMWARVPATVVR